MLNVLTNAETMVALLAVLPHISQFSEKLELPAPIPITTNDVARFTPSPLNGDVGGYLVLTNGSEFWVERGIVNGYRTPRSYYDLQRPSDIPRFYGPVNLGKAAAVQKARSALLKLGYDLKAVFADQEPEVKMPPQIGTNTVSYYSIQWLDPFRGGPSAVIDLSGIDGNIHKIRFFSPVFWPAGSHVSDAHRGPIINEQLAEEARRHPLMSVILEQGTSLASKLGLPMKLPLSALMVEQIEQTKTEKRIRLAGGFYLYFSGGYLRGFSSPDSFFIPRTDEERLPIESYLGEWNISTNDALVFARAVVRKAGLSTQELNIESQPETVLTPKQVGHYVIPRYYFGWTIRERTGRRGVTAEIKIEIDASTKTVKYLHVWDSHRWRDESKAQ